MAKTLGEIASLVDGKLIGDPDFVIKGLNGIKEAQEDELTFVENPKYFSLVATTKARAILVPPEVQSPDKNLVVCKNPSFAFSKVAALFSDHESFHPQDIHPTAIIDSSATIGKNVRIGPYTVIEKRAVIGDDCVIYAHCYIGAETKVGKGALIYPFVSIRERIDIGQRVIIHNGAVIGSDGFGFTFIDGEHKKIPQLGSVAVGDDVEIGANVTIDRARFGATIIGKGTKIDNLVHIAHNVRIGEHSIVIAQVGLSGSTTVGRNVILAGQAGVAGHLHIGDGAIVASQAGVTKDVPPGVTVSGYPAKPHTIAKRVNACLQRLPHYVKLIHVLQDKIEQLEKYLQKKTRDGKKTKNDSW